MNVLIVDDDKLARKGLIAIMDWEKYGFKVAGDVQNGRKALEFLRTHPVDIVFTDIDMPEIDGLELMQMCKEEFPDIKFVIFSVYENFSYAQTAIRMGALDYISKISFSPEECEQILERVSAKYRQTSRDGQADGEDREKLRELSRRWMYTGWIFNEKEFEDLCRETKEISLRSAERIFVKSFHDIQILSGGEGEFPSLDTVEEMLDWVRRWRENIYEVCRSTPQKNDICAFAAVILYVDEHIGEELRSEDAAERIGMSRSYFSTRFKEMTGKDPDYFEAHAIASNHLSEALEIVSERNHLPYSNLSPMDEYGTFCGMKIRQCRMRSMEKEYDPFLTLQEAVKNADPSVVNVFVTHPGYVDAYLKMHSSLTVNREKEVAMLKNEEVKKWLQENEVTLVSYKDIVNL